MVYSANEIFQVSEVQTTGHWKITFEGGPLAGLEDIRVTASDLPKPEHTPITVNVHGYSWDTPGIVKRSGQVTVTFFESVTAEVVLKAEEWYRAIYDNSYEDVTGIQDSAFQDLMAAKVILDLKDKQDVDKQQYTLYHCILVDFEAGGSLDSASESTDYFQPTMTISYAWYGHKQA
jgi:hypothetical protein